METADGPVRFRILAGAAHSWSTLIVQSDPGARFVYRTGTAELELIHRAAPEALTGTRAYRPESREWTAISAPPVAGVAAWPSAGNDLTSTDMAGEQPVG